MSGEPDTCPRCGAPRIEGPECPRCGVLYAKARPREAAIPAEPPPEFTPPPEVKWTLDDEQLAFERRARWCAAPAALAISWLLVKTGAGHAAARLFSGMWLHELGHAAVAWACGFPAFPGPWRTFVGEERSALIVLLFAGAALALAAWAWQAEQRRWIPAAAALLVLQLVCTAFLSRSRAQELVTFGGDGGCFVLATLLLASFYARAGSWVRKGALRWGFLVLGALGFMDAADTWWGAAFDRDRIPFGEIEGVGLSDPTKLVDGFGWSASELVHRYVLLSLVCLAALAGVYVLRAPRADVDALPEE